MNNHADHTANDECHAVIVTHNIGNRVHDTIVAARAICDHVIIIDNASSDDTYIKVQHMIGSDAACSLLRHDTNNLAAAQNIGIRHALAQGAKWVVMLDHDSVPDTQMVATMRNAYIHHPRRNHIGMLVPHLHERNSARTTRYTCHRQRLWFTRRSFDDHATLHNIMVAIASGCMIPRTTLIAYGLMDESFSIDNVDYDYSLRLVTNGRLIIGVADAILHHQLGKCRDHTVAGLRITTSNHKPLRRYYIYRNRMTLWRRYGRKIPAFIMFDICAIGYDLAKITMLEAGKRAKLSAIVSGVRDAWSGKQHDLSTTSDLNSMSDHSLQQLRKPRTAK